MLPAVFLVHDRTQCKYCAWWTPNSLGMSWIYAACSAHHVWIENQIVAYCSMVSDAYHHYPSLPGVPTRGAFLHGWSSSNQTQKNRSSSHSAFLLYYNIYSCIFITGITPTSNFLLRTSIFNSSFCKNSFPATAFSGGSWISVAVEGVGQRANGHSPQWSPRPSQRLATHKHETQTHCEWQVGGNLIEMLAKRHGLLKEITGLFPPPWIQFNPFHISPLVWINKNLRNTGLGKLRWRGDSNFGTNCLANQFVN